MEELPYVDTHAQRVEAAPDAVWRALLRVLERDFGQGEQVARALGCEPSRGTGALLGKAGEAVPGFRVVEAEPGRRLALRGHHRFARYALTFRLEAGELRAETHAAFPGVLGRLYRAAVIGSGSHRLLVRRMLRRIAHQAAQG